ncbi:hypothetical protein DFR71_0917 [Nocardia alba]|uniref:Uncharacterized protein n=1 Tax=Nocardia alba TaxID=225051 RepID=A0A4R1G7P0_9NOCA|nr:hypothetical protein DFR71_0917 [Nocardia alba]
MTKPLPHRDLANFLAFGPVAEHAISDTACERGRVGAVDSAASYRIGMSGGICIAIAMSECTRVEMMLSRP